MFVRAPVLVLLSIFQYGHLFGLYCTAFIISADREEVMEQGDQAEWRPVREIMKVTKRLNMVLRKVALL